MNFINNLFWPTLMTITIVTAAIGVGSLDAKEKGSRWIRNALVVYALPAFVIAMLGFNYATNTYSLADFFHCRDEVCKTAATADANQSYRIKLALAELAALALLGTTAWVRHWFSTRPDRYLPVESNNSPARNLDAGQRSKLPNFDPNKWRLDPETGEYYFEYYRSSNIGGLLDALPWQKRAVRYLQALEKRDQSKKIFLISLPISIVLFLIIFNNGFSWWAVVESLCLLFSGFAVLIGGIDWVYRETWLNNPRNGIGPEPVMPAGREEVEKQNAYGNAGVAGLQDIHNALKGGGAKPQQTAQGPLFDD